MKPAHSVPFIHSSYEIGRTIAALATPPGEGGIAIVRISGKKACEFADLLFSGSIISYASHTAHLGKILDETGQLIDRGLVLVMRAPHSFTGEDTVEFHCHGGMVIVQRLLQAFLRLGVHAAYPGEFTFKAFQNGKIDLTRAEAIQQVIGAQNELALQAAQCHLEGKLHTVITNWQRELVELLALIEAFVDFPDENFSLMNSEILNRIQKVKREIAQLRQTAEQGMKLTTDFRIALIGAPNAGKSSLLNAFLCKERAIVSSIPGTTRDTIEEFFMFGELRCRLLDTAGLRKTDDVIEEEGVKRAYQAAREADLILLLIDMSEPHIDLNWIETLPVERTLVVWNKIDLVEHPTSFSLMKHHALISVKENQGIESLKNQIASLLWGGNLPSKEQITITTQRHANALDRSVDALERVITGMQNNLYPELLAADLRTALKELASVIGIDIGEEVLSAIFSKFCVGK